MSNHPEPVPDEARSDMTPMIDVVFLMIVFFVCIDFRVLEAKLAAYLPKDVGPAAGLVPPLERVVVRVHGDAPGTEVYAAGFAAGTIDPATGRPARYRLTGHSARWEVGPRLFTDLAAARQELERIARDPQSQVPDRANGGRRLMPCVVEGQRGARYDDVARAVDACHAAGFAEIEFGSGG
ncbi:MAG: biopolymer transporter ExbD [Planctomycetes bacterium]|nr:biopolymer transporter ExbD [Planctomycetota bacterium]